MADFKVSVVIPTKDRPDRLAKLLDSVKSAGDYFDELIVVDSSAEYSNRLKVKQLVHRYGEKYIYEPKIGLSFARNTGIAESSGDIIVFADDDFVVRKGWIENLIRHYKDPYVMCCTGRMLPLRHDKVSQLYEKVLSFDRGTKQRIFTRKDISILNLLKTVTKIGKIRLEDKTPVPWAVGYGYCSFRKSVFDKVGVFDTSLGRGTPNLGGEDVDIFYRILKKGYKIVYEPKAVIYHDHRHTYEGILKDAYASGVSVKALVKKYYKRDLYMLFCMIGAFGLYVTSLIRVIIAGDSDLKKMILQELKGFLALRII